MAIVPSGLVNQQEIAEAVRRAEEALRPDVVLIRYSFGEDWTGDPSIFIRVLLSDEAAKRKGLQEVASRVSSKLSRELDADRYGLHAYMNFRSKSEQDMLKDPAWA